MTRRDFLSSFAKALGAAAIPALGLNMVIQKRRRAAKKEPTDTRYAFLVDTYKCTGCGLCVEACKLENGVPMNVGVSRTWIERYIVQKDGSVLADTPNAGLDGYTMEGIDIGQGKIKEVKPEDIEKAFFVPKLCNQCENPPCVQVCPVGATYQQADGVVLIDRQTCIGCGYCIMACPYGARFFHPKYKVAEKCNFCYHRLARGQKPACVEVCPFGARQIGNLKVPNDPVAKAVLDERLTVLKDEYGCKPQVYYRGLSREVR